MMKSIRFISSLSEKDTAKLENIVKTDSSLRTRIRAHSILLSAKRFDITEICNIFQVCRQTVSSWFERWDSFGYEGLSDSNRSGRPPKLTEKEQNIAIDLIKKYPQSIKKATDELFEKTGKNVSIWTLRRLAKKSLKWKRIRKSLKSKRNEEKFQKAKKDIQELKKKSNWGSLIFFF